RREKVIAAVRLPFLGKCERLPHIDRPPKQRVFEPGRHDAYNLNGLSVELNCASHYVWVAAKTFGPKAIGQNHNVVSARFKLFRVEYAASRRRDFQHWKEVGGCRKAQQTFRCLALLSQITVH